jgi:hypothetical protein
MPKINSRELPAEQMAALLAYAPRHGRFWKRELLAAWMNGDDANEPEGAVLRQIRNTQVPKLLARLSLSHLLA